MPHLHRFHTPGAGLSPGAIVELREEEAHHAARVLRIREAEEVALFDGAGNFALAQVVSATKRGVSARVLSHRVQPAPAPALTLLFPQLLRDKTLEEALENATAAGVNAFRIYRAARSEKAPKEAQRWQRTLIESCKQCGQLWLPSLQVYPDLASALAAPDWKHLFVAALEHEAEPLAKLTAAASAAIVIGPEGDFTPEELTLARTAGAVPVSLGALTLRSELAAVVAAALLGAAIRPDSRSLEDAPASPLKSP